jgi:hypothetical protein
MPPLQLHLNKGCAARLPQLNFQAGLTADEAQENWTKALLVHILASARLEQDIGVFIEWGPYSQSQNQVGT